MGLPDVACIAFPRFKQLAHGQSHGIRMGGLRMQPLLLFNQSVHMGAVAVAQFSHARSQFQIAFGVMQLLRRARHMA